VSRTVKKTCRESFDPAYAQWHAQFLPFESRCFDAVCEFVRIHFEELLERYYAEGNQSLNAFPSWAFERYLRELERMGNETLR
jgi:hypothetical protein